MGFIGFKSVDDAALAMKYYNKSYMDTMRLEVEYARKVGDNQLPRAWSKHTTGTSANKKVAGAAAPAGGDAGGTSGAAAGEGGAGDIKGAKGKKGKKGEPQPEDEDPKLREFLALMAPRAKARIWANDELEAAAADGDAAATAAVAAQRQQQQKAAAAAEKQLRRQLATGSDGEDDEDDDEYQDWSGAVAAAHRAAGDDSDEELVPGPRRRRVGTGAGEGDDDEDEAADDNGAAVGTRRGADAVVMNEAVSDLEYLRSRMKRWDEDEDEEEQEAAAGKKQQQQQLQGGKQGQKHDAAAARGDQSGVGTSPRCEGPAGAAAGKAAGRKGAAAAAVAAAGKRHTAGSDDEDADMEDGGGSEPGLLSDDLAGDADVDMRDADGTTTTAAAAAAARKHGPESGAGAGKESAGAGEQEPEEGIMDTGRLFVRNLAYTATEPDLSELFGGFGLLEQVHLVLDRETKRSKGVAYVQYQIPEDAVRAAQQLDGTIYQGRLLHILPAKRAPGSAAAAAAAATAAAGAPGQEDAEDEAGRQPGGPPGTSSFKAAREAQRKADAGNRAAWNTLFMRADTVAEAVAAHYGLSKAALLDASAGGGKGGDSVAVRMALGEAQVIAATKQALAEAGVSVEALERAAAASGKASASKAVARSPTTLLVKNLPFSADEDELLAVFGRCGPVARLVLPPAKALALVEFTEPQDARSAFRSLAYKKYHHVPLYLEWAPADVFSGPPPAKAPAAAAADKKAGGGAAASGAAAAKPGAAAPAAADVHPSDQADGDAEGDAAAPAVVGTIYVKNLAFATTDAALKKHFDKAVSAAGGSLHSALVARKQGKDGATLSLGYGFVEVDSEAIASLVIKKLQGSMLDGHKLALQLSRGRKTAPAGAAKAAAKKGQEDGSVKLVVRNLAFEATKKDIQGLFNPFGHLKSCRLPKKFDGSHRGFAFVEFVTKQEARNALEGVGGTHLYGRRLVVEYAKEDDGLDDIRNKTANKFRRDEEAEAGAAPAKRLKL
ncbi:hypothetical protein HYH02_003889 [Chlamydomonas schloesseri]|uniref:RRM domain-containing protein n=1 Tax=Chlamydomonas schloesseri TaxID=2026947 RepID=A0A836B973_9CHLO|nr:hypothetical protein HYH02_003889 [Chlamydomonas schloesseri]|eukprot:KAG2451283.1 hypothetical protein HYH02_003889 [Chlamydomonas schloesseri]